MGFLTGKTAIITGGGRAVLSDGSCGSIGYGIATAYAKEGANLVITGRNVKKLEDAKEELERLYGIKVLPVQADVSAGADNEATVQNVVKQAIDTFGRIVVLINNEQGFKQGNKHITAVNSTVKSRVERFGVRADLNSDAICLLLTAAGKGCYKKSGRQENSQHFLEFHFWSPLS